MRINALNPIRVAAMATVILFATVSSALSQAVKIGRCEVQSVDCTNMTITVQTTKDKETFTLFVTSRTRLFRNGEPAITCGFMPGDIGHGSAYTNAEDKVEAFRFYARQVKPN